MKQNPDKSDKADAWVLADLIRLGYLPKVWLAPEEIRQLRSLVRCSARSPTGSTPCSEGEATDTGQAAAASHPP